MPGFWKRPVGRTYAYNLDLGEHYYFPMKNYLESERGSRGETPGALTYSERLAKRWMHGRRYYDRESSMERQMRANSMRRESSWDRDIGLIGNYFGSSRAQSEVPYGFDRARTPPFEPERDMLNVSAYGAYKSALLDSAHQLRQESAMRQNSMASRQESESLANTRLRSMEARQAQEQRIMQQQQMQQQQQQQMQSTQMRSIQRNVSDDILKRMTDVRMSPYSPGAELDEAQSASAKARQRIVDLERELEEVTKRAMTTRTHASKTAAALAREANMEEDQLANSYKKTKKVMFESSSKMARA